MARTVKARSNQYTRGAAVETVRFTVRLPKDTNADFIVACKGEGRSRSEVATRLIMAYAGSHVTQAEPDYVAESEAAETWRQEAE